jgi:hypothetical protein
MIEEGAADLFDAAERLDLEGIVKRLFTNLN